MNFSQAKDLRQKKDKLEADKTVLEETMDALDKKKDEMIMEAWTKINRVGPQFTFLDFNSSLACKIRSLVKTNLVRNIYSTLVAGVKSDSFIVIIS